MRRFDTSIVIEAEGQRPITRGFSLNYSCHTNFASNLMCVKTTSLERVFEGFVRRFDTSVGITVEG